MAVILRPVFKMYFPFVCPTALAVKQLSTLKSGSMSMVVVSNKVPSSKSFTSGPQSDQLKPSTDYRKMSIKEVEIQTCGNLYEKWRKEKNPGYRKAPKDGLKLKVSYVDTKDLIPNTVVDPPVLLALHGSPGSHADYSKLINHLAPKGVRVIAPSFPHFQLIDTSVFRHSVHEKAEYVKDFLKTLNLNRIDMLVTHSAATYPGAKVFMSKSTPDIKSLVLLNPMGVRRMKAMKPAWFIDNFIVRPQFHPVSRWLYKRLAKIMFKVMGTAVDTSNPDNVACAAVNMYLAEVEEFSDCLKRIRDKKVPLLYVFSDNDGLVEKKLFLEMANILDIKETEMNVYDKEGNLEQKGSDGWSTTLRFKSGGHYAHLKYNQIVNASIEKLLRSVTKTNFK